MGAPTARAPGLARRKNKPNIYLLYVFDTGIREKRQACLPDVTYCFTLISFTTMAGRNASGNASAQNATVANATQPTTPEWIKAIINDGAQEISAVRPLVIADAEREFPDFGGQVPDGTYVLTAYCGVHEWKARNGRVSTIRTRYIRRESDNATFEVAFASFVAREWDFVDVNGVEHTLPFILPFDASQATTARRNLRVLDLAEGTRISVHHIRGHWANPLAQRVFNINLTYCSAVE